MTSEEPNINEIVRKRRSKWDVKSEPREVVEVSDDDDLHVKGDDLFKDKDLNSERKNNNRLFAVSAQELQSPKAFDVEPGDKDCLSKSHADKEIGNQATMKDTDDRRETDGWGTALDNQAIVEGTDGHKGTDGWGTALDNQASTNDTGGQGGTDDWGTALDNQSTMKDAMSPGLDARRQQNHSRSPARNHSRSPSGLDRNYRDRSRTRSRSRSRSRGHYYKERSESRADRGRFLHEDGGRRPFDRNYDTDMRGSRPERPKYPMYESKAEFSDLREQGDYSKGKLSQHRGDHYNDGGREKPGLARDNNRTTERCFDFTKGRCRRGASCRYIHHETNSRGDWSMKEAAKERTHDRNYPDAHFGRREEPRRVSEPCKFFAQGRCRNGDKCRFSHEILSQNPTRDVASNGTWGYSHNLNPGQHTTIVEASSSSLQIHGADGVPHTQNPQDIEGSTLSHTIFPNALTSEGQSTTRVISGQHQPVVSSTDNLPTALNFDQMNQSPHVLPKSNHSQNFPPHSPALPLNGQMQQIIHPVLPFGHGQLIAHETPNTQNIALSLQTQLILPQVQLSQQVYSPGGHIIPSLSPPVEKGQGQHSLRGQVLQNVPQNAHNQQNVNLSRQIQQSIISLEGQSEQNTNITSQVQQRIPLLQNAPSRQNVVPLAQTGQNHFDASQTSNFLGLSSADGSNQASDNLEMKSGVASLGAPITHKTVTSKQAARITDISASLVQIFGNAALNASSIGMQQSQPSVSTNSPVVPISAVAPLVQSGSLAQPPKTSKSDSMEPVKPGNSNLPSVLSSISSEQRDPRLREQQRCFKNLVLLSATDGANSSNESKLLSPSEHVAEMEIDATETIQGKKEQAANPDDGDADVGVDGEGKRSNDDKAIKVFKCALVEFVKELLKPTWKEGHMSREDHKTIVKKVVEKVTGAIQVSNIPQTQEKIDLYLSHSKPKLTKLVQAYVGKYVKS